MNELHVIVIDEITNQLLLKSGWAAGMSVYPWDSQFGPTFDARDFKSGEPIEVYFSKGDAIQAIAKYGKGFHEVTFKILSFVRKP